MIEWSLTFWWIQMISGTLSLFVFCWSLGLIRCNGIRKLNGIVALISVVFVLVNFYVARYFFLQL